METAKNLANKATKINWYDFLALLKVKNGKVDFSKCIKSVPVVVIEISLKHGTLKVVGLTLAEAAEKLQMAMADTCQEAGAVAKQLELF